jgi:hypothetical protein
MEKAGKKELIHVVAVYCDNCKHLFFDVFHREPFANPKLIVHFICPFCSTKLEVI